MFLANLFHELRFISAVIEQGLEDEHDAQKHKHEDVVRQVLNLNQWSVLDDSGNVLHF